MGFKPSISKSEGHTYTIGLEMSLIQSINNSIIWIKMYVNLKLGNTKSSSL